MRSMTVLTLFAAVLAISGCGSTSTPAAEPTASGPTGTAATTPASASTTPRTTTPDGTAPDTTTPDTTTPDTTTPDTTTPDTTTPDTTTSGTSPATLRVLVGTTWTVTGSLTVGGLRPAPAGADASLTFTDDGNGKGRVQVRTGCNSGSATITYDAAQQLTFGPLALTKKACPSDELSSLEAGIVAVTGWMVEWSVTDGTLTLIPSNITDSGLVLNDGASTPVSTDDTSPGNSAADKQTLLNTHWVLQRFITVGPLDVVPAGTGAGIQFVGDDQLDVNTGCNEGSGAVQFAADGTFTVGTLTLTEVACADDGLEARIVGLLGSPQYWSVRDDTLTIYPSDVSDSGMIFRDADAPADEPTSTTPAQDAAVADRAAVLAAAVADRVASAGPSFTDVAIVDELGRPASDGTVVLGVDDVAMTAAEKAAIEAAVPSIRVRWAASANDPVIVTARAAGQIGAIVTLTDPVVEGTTAKITTGVTCGTVGTECGRGGGVVLERQSDRSWKVTGDFGPQWVS